MEDTTGGGVCCFLCVGWYATYHVINVCMYVQLLFLKLSKPSLGSSLIGSGTILHCFVFVLFFFVFFFFVSLILHETHAICYYRQI